MLVGIDECWIACSTNPNLVGRRSRDVPVYEKDGVSK